jgi:hypothetical protein
MTDFLLILILFALMGGIPTGLGFLIMLPLVLLIFLMAFALMSVGGALIVKLAVWLGLPTLYALSRLPLIDHEWWFVYAILALCALIYLMIDGLRARAHPQPTYVSFRPQRTPMPIGPTSPITFRVLGR